MINTANTADRPMKYSEGAIGRVFILTLKSGDILHESVERFASEKHISAATVIAVGGADKGSRLTVGPKIPLTSPIQPLYHELDGPHELTGTGTIFENGDGKPVMHMHCSCGRDSRSVTGCVRAGVVVWLTMEVVITEIKGASARRLPDKDSGFELLTVG